MLIFLSYLVLGLAPGAFWLWYYLIKDRKRPEPGSRLIKIFVLGMLCTIPAAFLQIVLDNYFHFTDARTLGLTVFGMLVIVAPIEEASKFFVVKHFVYDKGKFDEAFDGVIYAIVASLGFASAENILSAFSSGPVTLIWRAITATLLHALVAGVWGYFMGIARFDAKREKRLLAQGLIAGIIIHGVYNTVLQIATPLSFLLVFFLLGLVFALVSHAIVEVKRRDDRVLGG